MKKKLEFYHCIILIVGVLILDQFLKVYIKLNFPLTIYSDQIKINLNHPNKFVAKEYLEVLINLFDKDGIDDRQLEYNRTIEFVNSRASILEEELNIIEKRKRTFNL